MKLASPMPEIGPMRCQRRRIALPSTDLNVPVTWMRSVGSAASVFALECFPARRHRTDPGRLCALSDVRTELRLDLRGKCSRAL